jgi:hypothetical protein
MLVVTITAHQQSLIHAMVKRPGKIRLYVKMAAVTELRLRSLEKPPFNLRSMHGVAINAADIILQVFGPHEVAVFFAEFVAIEAPPARIG